MAVLFLVKPCQQAVKRDLAPSPDDDHPVVHEKLDRIVDTQVGLLQHARGQAHPGPIAPFDHLARSIGHETPSCIFVYPVYTWDVLTSSACLFSLKLLL